MYLRQILISNVRALKEVAWTIPAGREAGWHVILGDNGAGKTTFLRAAVLGILRGEGLLLQGSPSHWVGPDALAGHVTINSSHQAATFTFLPSSIREEWRGPALDIFSAAYGPFRRFTGGDREKPMPRSVGIKRT